MDEYGCLTGWVCFVIIRLPVAWGEVSAHVAQPAEHILGKNEVTGSNPVVGSRSYEVQGLRAGPVPSVML